MAASEQLWRTATADFYDGIFRVLQTSGAKPMTRSADREAELWEERQGERSPPEEEEAEAVGRREGQVPDRGRVQLGYRARYAVADGGHLQEHADTRGQGRVGPRLRQEEDCHGTAGNKYVAKTKR